MANIFNVKDAYITPIILRYVDKFIKDIRLEDTQVSLWGGEAVFHNLSLRLDVLEQELNLPFSFVSGQIHELAINVPWTKLHAEPITVTINTIECVLKLKSDGSGNNDTASTSSKGSRDSKKKAKRAEVESPPGYVQSIVNRIVSNVCVRCNNLILKYVEEDMVLSLNVRSVVLQSANQQWQPAFTELSVGQLILRKLVTLQDLTVCLDRRNASGKIEVYEEPLLYRCSLELRVSRTYAGLAASRATSMRVDVHCGRMNFSVSDQQLPMLLRVLRLGLALYLGELKNEAGSNMAAGTSDEAQDENPEEGEEGGDSWVGWAWSFVPSLLPGLLEEEEYGNTDSLQPSSTPYTLQLGFYVDQLTFIFKASESTLDRTYYGPKKVRFHPLTVLEVWGCYMQSVLIGFKSVGVSVGASLLLISPSGEACACGVKDTQASNQAHFLAMGQKCSNYLKSSFFDPECDNFELPTLLSWDEHLNIITESVLLDKTPGFAIDYRYLLGLPDNRLTADLTDLSAEIESGSFAEQALCRFVVAPLQAHVCSGLVHRLQLLLKAAQMYTYPPYSDPTPEPALNDLPPCTEEAVALLESNMPLRAYQLTLFKPVVHIYLANHPTYDPSNRQKKVGTTMSTLSLLPHLSIECQCLDSTYIKPMYPMRLAPLASQAVVSKEVQEKCHHHCNIKLLGLACHLSVQQQPMTILIPSHVSLHLKQLVYPHLWQRNSISVLECSLETETLTTTLTKAQALLIQEILLSYIDSGVDSKYAQFCTPEASKSMPFLELNVEGFKCRMVKSPSTLSHRVTVQSVRVFALRQSATSVEQVLVLSSAHKAEEQLLSATVQYQTNPSLAVLPTLLGLKLNKIDICVDPLLLEWLAFTVKDKSVRRNPSVSQSSWSEVGTSGSRQIIQSTSFESRSHSTTAPQEPSCDVEFNPEPNPGVEIMLWKTKFLQWYTDWYSALTCIEISPCIVYFPKNSLSSLGSQSIEETFLKSSTSDVLVLKLPLVQLYSSNYTAGLPLAEIKLPVALHRDCWRPHNETFPWSLALRELECSTLIGGTKKRLLHPLSVSCTIGITSQVEQEVVTAVALCVHIDTPVMQLAVCKHQLELLLCMLKKLQTVFVSKQPQQQQQQQQPQQQQQTQQQQQLPQEPPQWGTVQQADIKVTTPPATIQAPSVQQTNVASSTTEPCPWPQREDTVKLSAWCQWTMARLVVSLYAADCCAQSQRQLKLTCDVEDMMTSVDIQQIYLKLKSKVATALVQHFCRPNKDSAWQPGPHMGLLLHCTDEAPAPLDATAPSPSTSAATHGLLSITFTRVLSRNVHERWAQQVASNNLGPGSAPSASLKPRFINEILVKLCPLDIVLPVSVLADFLPVFQPLLATSTTSKVPWQVNNNTLPLLYLDTEDIRLFLPVDNPGAGPDLCIVQLHFVSVRPQVENPLSRVYLRPDIYHLAQEAGILNVPGSQVEDRQYQLNVCKLAVHTGLWHQVEAMFQSRGGEVNPLSENPAVEWNRLAQTNANVSGRDVSLLALLHTLDVSLIVAPAIVYQQTEHLEILVCGHSAELNPTSDIEISITTDQLATVSLLLSRWLQFISATTQLISVQPSPSPLPDSGIDDQSSLHSRPLGSLANRSVPEFIPSEVLITASKIVLTLYDMRQQLSTWQQGHDLPADLGYDASEDSSVESLPQNPQKVIHPLLYARFVQPHLLLACHSMKQKVEVSCFDMALGTSCESLVVCRNSKRLTFNKVDCFTLAILHTKNGDPHPKTGIPPSLLTATWSNFLSKTGGELQVELGRPVQLHVDPKVLSCIKEVETLLRKFLQPLQLLPSPTTESQASLVRRLWNIPCVTVKTSQVLLSSTLSGRDELMLSVTGIAGSFSSKPSVWSEKGTLQSHVQVDSLQIKVIHDFRHRIFLQPCTFTWETVFSWDPWLTPLDNPSVQTSLKCQLMLVNLGPDQAQCLATVWQLLKPYLLRDTTCEVAQASSQASQDEHYRDDLRAGAFQFINIDIVQELPLPYQVLVSESPLAMAWRYPQPRVITCVEVLPLPLVSAGLAESEGELQVSCVLQYWSKCKAQYVSYGQFSLSESRRSYLNLPSVMDKQNVIASSCWRMLVHSKSNHHLRFPPWAMELLVARVRVDSFFSASLVPQWQVALNVGCLSVDLTCQTGQLGPVETEPLRKYFYEWSMPDAMPIVMLELNSISVLTSGWACGTILHHFETQLGCDIVDMATLTKVHMLEQMSSTGKVVLSQTTSKQPIVDVALTTGSIRLKFGVTTTHTLLTAARLWQRALRPTFQCLDVVPAQYVLCNTTGISIQLRQSDTEEKIVLSSGRFHMYAWLDQRKPQTFLLSLAEPDWTWSQPLSDKLEQCRVVQLSKGCRELGLVWRVKALSSTQKMILISGQLVLINKLQESFDLQVLTSKNPPDTDIPGQWASSEFVTLPGHTTSPSILISNTKKLALKIRFQNMVVTWSGEIPLTSNSNSLPWLVKVPLEDKGQFLSLWCRVVKQPVTDGNRIVAILAPLYSVRSLLPSGTHLSISTPGLNVELPVMVQGQGATQQLYCPGTIEHTHQVKFLSDNQSKAESSCVPLSYNSIQQADTQHLSVPELDNFIYKMLQKREEAWPFVESSCSSSSSQEWVTVPHAAAEAKVTHRLAGPLESTLQLQLQPWALLVNLLDIPIRLVAEEQVQLAVPPRGVIIPQPIEGTFYLSAGGEANIELSPPLQLQQLTSSGSFYIPRILGVIPVNGSLCTTIPTWGGKLMLVTVTSRVIAQEGNMRVLSARPTVILHCAVPLAVLPVCVPSHSRALSLPDMSQVPLQHTTALRTEPVLTWHCLVPAPSASPLDLAFYLLVQAREEEWACPLLVSLPSPDREGCSSRQCLDVAGEALVLTTHIKAGQLFAVFSKVTQPQLRVQNHCRFALVCAEAKPGSVPVAAVESSKHLSWRCQVAPGASITYTMPSIQAAFPGPAPRRPALILARAQANPLGWSESVYLSSMADYFVSLPGTSDVSVQVRPGGGATVSLSVHCVSRIEISAKEIRARLQPNSLQQRHSLQAAPYEPLPAVTPCSEQSCVSPSSQQPPLPTQLSLTFYIASAEISVLSETSVDSSELLLLTLDHVCASVRPSAEQRELLLSVADIQLDNQMSYQGGFDFPVILTRQEPMQPLKLDLSNPKRLRDTIQAAALLNISLTQELGADMQAVPSLLRVSMRPISVYVEDTLLLQCGRLLEQFTPASLVLMPAAPSSAEHVLPHQVQWEAREAASPIQVARLVIEPLSVLVSLHTSLKVFIALDRSPLHFAAFERNQVCTTSYHLGHELTRHYLSGALFRAGWVVGSLELLGSPSGFALTVGSGLRDFVCLPYLGILQGPWGFLAGITHGSASLMKHVTAGTLSSITNLASSVARNLERCSLDREHVERAEEARRQRPQGVGQGMIQGLSSLGISLLGAVSGIAHHPLQILVHQPAGSSQLSGLMAGVGLGLVGAITKPLSGAAELVALTGQGLLHGAGWSSMPQTRRRQLKDTCVWRASSQLSYAWKLLGRQDGLLQLCVQGTKVDEEGNHEPVMLLLTTCKLIVSPCKYLDFKVAFKYARVTPVVGDDTMLCIRDEQILPRPRNAPHWRVEDFVRDVGMPNPQQQQQQPVEQTATDGRCVPACNESRIGAQHVHVQVPCEWRRQHLLNLLQIARRQAQYRGFSTLLERDSGSVVPRLNSPTPGHGHCHQCRLSSNSSSQHRHDSD